MSFIDNTYFVGEIQLPNVTTNATAINQAIGQYEKEILIQLLGYKLYSLLIADLDESGSPQSQIYKDLVNGAEFTHTFAGDDYLLKWNGLVNDDLQSLIAYYVFYKYLERDITRVYGSGVSMVSTEKGMERVSPVNKLCEAWERMRELYGRIPPEYKRRYTWPQYYLWFDRGYSNLPVKADNLPFVFNCDPSAYNFLFANKTDYPDWIFTPQWNINQFGI